jgi:hypothetical protein
VKGRGRVLADRWSRSGGDRKAATQGKLPGQAFSPPESAEMRVLRILRKRPGAHAARLAEDHIQFAWLFQSAHGCAAVSV